MRKTALVLALLLASTACFAVDLTTRGGVVYKDATVTKVEVDGIRIKHAAGFGKIPFEDLSDALQKQYNYDPAKVAEHRKQLEDARKAAADQAAEQQRQRQESADRMAREAREQKDTERATAQRVEKERVAGQERAKATKTAEKAREKTVSVVLIVVAIVAGLFIHFLPSIIGRHKTNWGAILVLNILLGWTFIGWVVALVWALTKDSSAAPPNNRR